MPTEQKSKLKIFNDPVYGFISIPQEIIVNLIDHPYFQRLRRIRQLGMSHLVYPGALHTRFHHAMGAMHLMTLAIDILRSKGHKITEEEATGVTIAILLHDIGHGPFSHALEHTLVDGVHHEEISSMFMEALNKDFGGKLTMAINIFNNKYKKKFLHQLVSSQLDMDRLDYLKRDSFFTGVSEGVVSSDRILKMLDVRNDELVIEEKGIYSIEKFIVARRLMYWQVYLHKTVVAAENLLINILRRAKELAKKDKDLFGTPALKYFLYKKLNLKDFKKNNEPLKQFALLDDNDIVSAIKVWCDHKDKVLSKLCYAFLNRNLYKIEISNKPFAADKVAKLEKELMKKYKLDKDEVKYFVIKAEMVNNAYNPMHDHINILYKNEKIADITDASDNFNIAALARPVKKYGLGYFREK
ncbi:MAG TPA: HD domain-containing protein [Flavobacteriales bacterium]|nr:HD domain-containing protein [Flavobacteriales bacterium]